MHISFLKNSLISFKSLNYTFDDSFSSGDYDDFDASLPLPLEEDRYEPKAKTCAAPPKKTKKKSGVVQEAMKEFLKKIKYPFSEDELEISAGALYFKAIFDFPKDMPGRDGEIKKYIVRGLEEEFKVPEKKDKLILPMKSAPKEALPADLSGFFEQTPKKPAPPLPPPAKSTRTRKNKVKIADEEAQVEKLKVKLEAEYEKEMQKSLLFSDYKRILSEHPNVLKPNHKKILLNYFNNGGNCYALAKEMGLDPGDLATRLRRYMKKLTDIDKLPRNLSYEDKVLNFIKENYGDIRKLMNSPQKTVKQFDEAFMNLNSTERTIFHFKFMADERKSMPQIAEFLGVKRTALYEVEKRGIVKLGRMLGIRKEITPEKEYKLVQKYKNHFSELEYELKMLQTQNPENKLSLIQLAKLTGYDYDRVRSAVKAANNKIQKILFSPPPSAKEQEDKIKAIKKSFLANKDKLTALQNEIILARYFSEEKATYEILAKKHNVAPKAILSAHRQALQILGGEMEIAPGVVRQSKHENYKKLFEEKECFFDGFQKRQMEVFLSGMTLDKMAQELDIKKRNLQEIKENYLKILETLSVEDYLTMKNKLKSDVKAALESKKHSGVTVEIIKERFLSDNPLSLREIGKKYGLDKNLTLLCVKKLHTMGIETDLPSALL